MSDKHSFGRIDINKLVSTIILGTSFSMILLFGLIFYMYFDAKSGYTSALKESFSITASFFGGVTTLVAAYVAAKLFNDWSESQTGVNRSELAKSIHIALIELKILCDYYYEMISIDILLDEAVNDPEISQDFKKRRIERNGQYQTDRDSFKDEYKKKFNKLKINIKTYETIFSVRLLPEEDDFYFNSYSFHIAGLYSFIQRAESLEKLKEFKKFAYTEKLKFEKKYMSNILEETSKFINLTKHN